MHPTSTEIRVWAMDLWAVAMLAVKRLADVAPEVNTRNHGSFLIGLHQNLYISLVTLVFDALGPKWFERSWHNTSVSGPKTLTTDIVTLTTR